MTEPSVYVLEPLRKSPVLVVALTAKQPSPQGLQRLEHEYLLAAELDAAWAAKPLALTRHDGQTVLILKDPGGEPLDLVPDRSKGQPLDLTRFLLQACMRVVGCNCHKSKLREF